MNPDCPADEELLAMATDEGCSPEMREHVERCTECRMRVKRLAGEVAELRAMSGSFAGSLGKTVMQADATQTLSPGTIVGRYNIVGIVASGGQADVYRIVDSELERFLILKLSHQRSEARPGQRDAMLAEGRLLAELDHPGLVRVFDVGFYDGRPYLVLEHVPGRNLEQTFADKRPSVRDAARLIAAVAHVVAYAHRHGITHGDITPRNILIDRDGRPRLIDFGLSTIEDAWNDATGPIGGTPEFLPPENAPFEGYLRRSGPAGDVFGLGATMYWLLTGLSPFGAETIVKALERSRRCDIDFETLQRANVPRSVQRICRQALAADPSQRPDPETFGRALERATRQWASPLTVGSAVVSLLIAGGLVLLWNTFGDPQPVINVPIVHSIPIITVFRGDSVRTLSNEIPLHTGDRISVACNIAPGHSATVLWFNTAGELKTLQPERDVADKIDRLVYPAPDRSMPLEGPEGTEVIFFCRGTVDVDGLSDCFPIGKPLPAIPSHNWLLLQHSEVRIEGALHSDISGGLRDAKQTMKEIDRRLRRYFQGVTAIAFPHYPAVYVEN